LREIQKVVKEEKEEEEEEEEEEKEKEERQCSIYLKVAEMLVEEGEQKLLRLLLWVVP